MGEIWYEQQAQMQDRHRFWWKAPDEDMASAVSMVVDRILERQRGMYGEMLHHARLYSNRSNINLGADGYIQYRNDDTEESVYNVIESAVDTVQAELVSQRSKVMFLTDGAAWDARERAKAMNRYVDGQFWRTGFHKQTDPDITLDALALGTGYAKNYTHNKTRERCIERVFTPNIVVDDMEAKDRRPRSMYEIQSVPREAAIAIYAYGNRKLEEKLREAPASRLTAPHDKGTRTADMIDLFEAVHLAPCLIDEDESDKDAKAAGGVRVLGTRNATIACEPWRHPWHPWTALRYKNRLVGWHGKGLAEIMRGTQGAINHQLWKIHESLRLSGPKIFVPTGSDVGEMELDNEVWGVIYCDEQPMYTVFDSVPPDLFRQLMTEIEQAYNMAGVNMMSVQGDMPGGLDGGSGRAIRLYADTKSKRYTVMREHREQFAVDVAEKDLTLARDERKRDSSYELKVVAPTDDGDAKLVEIEDVDLDRDRFIMQPWPTNYFSSSPSSKTKEVEELMQILPEEMRPSLVSALDFPDVKAFTRLIQSEDESIRKLLEEILYKEKDHGVIAEINPNALAATAKNYIIAASIEGVPEARIQAVREYVKRHLALHQTAQQAAQAAPPPQAAPPQGAPPPQGPPPQQTPPQTIQ